MGRSGYCASDGVAAAISSPAAAAMDRYILSSRARAALMLFILHSGFCGLLQPGACVSQHSLGCALDGAGTRKLLCRSNRLLAIARRGLAQHRYIESGRPQPLAQNDVHDLLLIDIDVAAGLAPQQRTQIERRLAGEVIAHQRSEHLMAGSER